MVFLIKSTSDSAKTSGTAFVLWVISGTRRNCTILIGVCKIYTQIIASNVNNVAEGQTTTALANYQDEI